MSIQKNSRQMPSSKIITKEKNYCDLLYAWLQCNSELLDMESRMRYIERKNVKWARIERDFTRQSSDGAIEKVMDRKTIAKYFRHLEEKGLVKLNKEDDNYYLTVLDNYEANLIEYKTVSSISRVNSPIFNRLEQFNKEQLEFFVNGDIQQAMNVFQKNSISIYIYLFNRYFANDQKPFIVTMRQIKEFIGIATSTTSNNMLIDDTLDILKRLKLLDYEIIYQDGKTMFQFKWVKNKLP